MKSTALPQLVIIAVLVFCSHAHTQEPQQATFPFYVRLIQEYKYPGTGFVSSAGMIEQVVGEQLNNYIVSTPTGSTLNLPKSLARRVSEAEAAEGLIAERANHDAQMKEATDYVKKMAAYIASIQANQQQPNRGDQETLEQLQQLLNSQSRGGISRSERAKLERAVCEAGLARSLYVARQMSDADLSALYPQALQILELKRLNRK